MTAREERKWEAEENATELKNMDYTIKRTGTRQIKLAPMKMETCPCKGRI